MRRLRRACLTVLATALCAAPALAQTPDAKRLRLGVEGAYPPFSEVGPDGKL